jgi:hypothetical protein
MNSVYFYLAINFYTKKESGGILPRSFLTPEPALSSVEVGLVQDDGMINVVVT